FRRRLIQKASDVWYNDPLGGEGLPPEAAFMARSLAYLQAKQNDSLYAQLWTQYLRVRCLFYRQLVADPAEVGLSTFSRRYQRISHYIDADFAALAVAFTLDEPGLDVKAVEVRSAPPRSTGACRRKAAAVREHARQVHKQDVEFGWVFHFIRSQDYS